jgi:hypothetical protein
MGDVSPSISPTPKKNKCGMFGAILMAIVAIAVAIWVGPQMIAFFQGAFGGLAAGGAVIAGSAGAIAGGIVGGAITGAIGSVLSQGVGIALGIQDKFSWKAVGLAALGGGVGGGIGASGLFGKVVDGAFEAGKLGIKSAVIDAAVRAGATSAITQGIAVATNLQDKFSWAGVAAAAVGAGVGEALEGVTSKLGHGFAREIGAKGDTYQRIASATASLLSNSASAIANAATRSALEGTSFGAAIVAAIPDIVANALTNYVSACFVGDTPVHTPRGLRRIDEIRVGDWVYARAEDFGSEEVRPRRVNRIFQFEERATVDVTLAFGNGQETTLRTTPEHPFAVRDGILPGLPVPEGQPHRDYSDTLVLERQTFSWKSAGQLSIGMQVIDIQGRTGLVTAIEPVDALATVHNFAVEEDHTYFVGDQGVWVHNQYMDDIEEVLESPSTQSGPRTREQVLNDILNLQVVNGLLASEEYAGSEYDELRLEAGRRGSELLAEAQAITPFTIGDGFGSVAGAVTGTVKGIWTSIEGTAEAIFHPIDTIKGAASALGSAASYIGDVAAGDANILRDAELALTVWAGGHDLEAARLLLTSGWQASTDYLFSNAVKPFADLLIGTKGVSAVAKAGIAVARATGLTRLVSGYAAAFRPVIENALKHNLITQTGRNAGRLNGNIRNGNVLRELLGVAYAAREADRLGYRLVQANMNYNAAGHGLDMVFQHSTTGRYAIWEAKNGSTLASLGRAGGKLQGTNEYNLLQLQRTVAAGGPNAAFAQRLIPLVQANQVESWVTLRGSSTTVLMNRNPALSYPMPLTTMPPGSLPR